MTIEEDVLAEIARIAEEELELARPIRPEDAIAGDLELDSLSLTVLAVGLEDRFRVKLREEDTAATTVADLARLVARRVREEAA